MNELVLILIVYVLAVFILFVTVERARRRRRMLEKAGEVIEALRGKLYGVPYGNEIAVSKDPDDLRKIAETFNAIDTGEIVKTLLEIADEDEVMAVLLDLRDIARRHGPGEFIVGILLIYLAFLQGIKSYH